MEKLHHEMNILKEQSIRSEYDTCAEENSLLKRKAADLQHEFDMVSAYIVSCLCQV